MISTKFIILLASVLLSFLTVVSQANKHQLQTKGTSTAINFPGSFVGNWKGEMVWLKPGKNTPETFIMELRVHPSTDSAGQYTWNIIYGSENKDNRPYILKAIDSAKGHWVVDELNEIVLDQYWIDHKFQGVFSVQNSTIVNSYWIENGKMHIEFLTYSTKPINTTGKGDTEIPLVDSYEVRSYQRGLLSRIN